MKFIINHDLLSDMFYLNGFVIPQDQLVFVALRGVTPLILGGSDFKSNQEVLATSIDYLHMRCTICIWDTNREKLTAFVGSSVPHQTAIAKKIGVANGDGVNRLASGYFGKLPGMADHRYFKGNHGYDRHLAFRNESKLPVWRSADDLYCDGNDRFEYEVVYDNLHCSRQTNEAASHYDSFGCVVVAGKEGVYNAKKISTELGPWKKFLEYTYGVDQRHFTLVVFEEGEALRTSLVGLEGRSPTVRFGSKGMLAGAIQMGLQKSGYAIGSSGPDSLFGPRSVSALREFQVKTFGKNGTDLIAGPATAEALGIKWPKNAATLFSEFIPADNNTGEETEAVGADTEVPPNHFVNLTEDQSLAARVDTTYDPQENWSIRKLPGKLKWQIYSDALADPLKLGYLFEYTYGDGSVTAGLARTANAKPNIHYKPEDWLEFGYWPELIFPTAWAESNARFTVINAWDRAAMTFGFIQLAAHTGDDFLPFFRRLFDELPFESKKWFPELDVIDGQLCFIKGNSYKNLERKIKPSDGGYSASYYHGDLMQFFNPDRYHSDKKPDAEELHAAGRWLAWSFESENMRRVQVAASIENMENSLLYLHRKMQADAAVRARFPNGVDGMRCDLLSVAIAVPHLGESKIDIVLDALKTNDPIESIGQSNYGPGGRSMNVDSGMKKRPVLKDLIYDLSSRNPV